jgi:hypothetical protein
MYCGSWLKCTAGAGMTLINSMSGSMIEMLSGSYKCLLRKIGLRQRKASFSVVVACKCECGQYICRYSCNAVSHRKIAGNARSVTGLIALFSGLADILTLTWRAMCGGGRTCGELVVWFLAIIDTEAGLYPGGVSTVMWYLLVCCTCAGLCGVGAVSGLSTSSSSGGGMIMKPSSSLSSDTVLSCAHG